MRWLFNNLLVLAWQREVVSSGRLQDSLRSQLGSCQRNGPDRCPVLCKGQVDCIALCQQVAIQLCDPSQPPAAAPVDTVAASTTAASAAVLAVKDAVAAAIRESARAVRAKFE